MEFKELPKNKAQVFDNPHKSLPCDMFNCRKRADYFIGRRDAPLSTCMKICEDCLISVVESLGFKEEDFICPECNESFKSKKALNAHMRVHKDDKE